MKIERSSFRDSDGFVFYDSGDVYRGIHKNYSDNWQHLCESGLLAQLKSKKLLIDFEEVSPKLGTWKSLKVSKIPFISYPYEWSFQQLKAAALCTLEVQLEALKYGMVLKDASAFNIQFNSHCPVFIDVLSFTKRVEGEPWQAYRQFCMHFLAPLLLYKKYGKDVLNIYLGCIDGIDLSLASQLLPWSSFFSPMALFHIHLHARAQKIFCDGVKAASRLKSSTCSFSSIVNICENLHDGIAALTPPDTKTEWDNYYCDTNYSKTSAEEKYSVVQSILSAENAIKPLALDIGSNNGMYTKILEPFFEYIVAADIDFNAVGQHYQLLKDRDKTLKILPLVLNLSNPTPAIGWASEERASFLSRMHADCVMALALIHHLFFTYGIKFEQIATCFANMLFSGGLLILEFVPSDDSQIVRMTAARNIVFHDYNITSFRTSMDKFFVEEAVYSILETKRVILKYRKK